MDMDDVVNALSMSGITEEEYDAVFEKAKLTGFEIRRMK